MKTDVDKAWEIEVEKHLGDYGDSSEYDLYCAFKAGWIAHKRMAMLEKKCYDKSHEVKPNE